MQLKYFLSSCIYCIGGNIWCKYGSLWEIRAWGSLQHRRTLKRFLVVLLSAWYERWINVTKKYSKYPLEAFIFPNAHLKQQSIQRYAYFLSVCAFPGSWTHDLGVACSVRYLLSYKSIHWKALNIFAIFYILLWSHALWNIGVNAMLRKVACAAASKPHVEIRQNGEQFYIKTSTTVRTTEINFQIGQEFNEETVDGRKCKVQSDMNLEFFFIHFLITELNRITC